MNNPCGNFSVRAQSFSTPFKKVWFYLNCFQKNAEEDVEVKVIIEIQCDHKGCIYNFSSKEKLKIHKACHAEIGFKCFKGCHFLPNCEQKFEITSVSSKLKCNQGAILFKRILKEYCNVLVFMYPNRYRFELFNEVLDDYVSQEVAE